MLFIETTIFTKKLPQYLSDDEYAELQYFLAETPDFGDLIRGTGGLRKLRWSTGNKGKRGGVRVIYYWRKTEEQIYFMTLYAKNEVAELSSQEKRALKKLLEETVVW